MVNNFPLIFDSGSKGFLFIDPSASHLAWALATIDLGKKEIYFSAIGMAWTSDKWSKGKRFKYMQKVIEILMQGDGEVIPNAVVTEAFFVNPRMMVGSAVIPTVNAFIQMSADTHDVRYLEIGPSSWRGILGVKAVKDAKGKKDYKAPAAQEVSKFLKVPEEIQSNINSKMRQTPHDVTDVLALALAVAKHHGVLTVSSGNTAFSPFITIEKLKKESEKI
jgi:Holliday junction resolvasome RuvABC endonuclease subunit